MNTAAPSRSHAMVHASRRLFRVVTGNLFGVVFAFVVFLAYGNLPNRWYHVLSINSGSMAPTIQPGDLIIITPKPAVLKPGMILTLSVNGHLVTHRLVGFGEYGELITQGDANAVPDDWSDATVGIVGLYRARIPYLGYLAVLPGRLGALAASGAWFTAEAELPGVLSADAYWQPGVRLEGSLTAVPYLEAGQHGVALSLCLTNTGAAWADGLSLSSRLEAGWGDSVFGQILTADIDTSARPALEPGGAHCYEERYPLDPTAGNHYRVSVEASAAATPSDQTGSLTMDGGQGEMATLELMAEFVLLEVPAPADTPAPTPSDELPAPTPTPEVPPTSVPVETVTPGEVPTATPEPTFAPAATTLGATLLDITAVAEAEGTIVGGQVCVLNTGLVTAEGLAITAHVQFRVTDDAYVDVLDAVQTLAGASPLAPQAVECYPVAIRFSIMPNASYQLAASVTITNHAGWLPGEPGCPGPDTCPYGPEVRAEFALPPVAEGVAPANQLPANTTETPVP